ncbi:hypothetical protein CDL12_18554 [Handroanthus impetiginosus]|uniref:DUF620 domain-containing protein n=1 Tax=Handroanthus impetiginosus TaxID=429701 RepID=A0A2G9GUC6_9LAMI|nr:hypothetical protein CDL12_18554 [Handroanthus impetiginosus]
MVNHSMRKLCPNLDKEDGLETVLEVPIPEEMFNKMGSNAALRWHNMRNLMRAHHHSTADKWAAVANPLATACSSSSAGNDQFMLLLKLVGSPFIPCRAQLDHTLTKPIKDGSIEASTAKYIVQQYLAATGGLAALNSINSMYAVGQVKMVVASDAVQNFESAKRSCEAGGFVLWQKNPDLWYLELIVSGYKISAGSDGKIAWSQSSTSSTVSRGPPRPLRRFFQGLDPRSTANLFLNTVCIGEKTIKNEDCFILKFDTSSDILKAQSTPNTEIVYHTIWGYFSQRTGLLVQFEDTKLIRMKTAVGDDSVFYETSMESVLEDYRLVEGINIAHSGKTIASLYRYGKTLKRKWKLEESWKIEEVDFNICGLSFDYFLPPADVKKDNEHDEHGI